MKKLLGLVVLTCTVLSTVTGCSNYVTKKLGGTMNLNLQPNTKLVNITWKDDSLWYLTRPMREDEEAETLTFEAKTELGVFEGKVIINESKN